MKVFGMKAKGNRKNNSKPVLDSKPILEINRLYKSFGGIKAVENCSFSVAEGKVTSLIGPNGAGKTTVFNLISGIISQDHGKIYFNSEEISKLQIHNIAAKGISRTFQAARLFKYLTVKENLLVARDIDEEEMKQLLADFHFHKPLSTIVSELSYGQQRIVELARALLFPHELLMLDEPTAGLNQRARQELKVALKKLKKEKKTVLLIEHDMDFVMDISDEIIVLAEGKVLRCGKPSIIRKDPKVLEVYLGK